MGLVYMKKTQVHRSFFEEAPNEAWQQGGWGKMLQCYNDRYDFPQAIW